MNFGFRSRSSVPEVDASLPELPFVELDPVIAILADMIAERLGEDSVVKPHPMRKRIDVFKTLALGGRYENATATNYTDTAASLIVDDRFETEEATKQVWRHRSGYHNLGSYVMPLLQGRRHTPAQTTPIETARASTKEVSNLLVQKGFTVSTGSGFQQGDALHFERSTKELSDFSTLRIYVASGLAAFGLTKQLLEIPTFDVDGGKIWFPDVEKRTDAPIFYVSSHEQLESVLNGLYDLKEREHLVTYPSPYSLGQRVKNLPGVYIAQAPSAKSFNRVMGDVWGEALPGALKIHNLKVGQVATEAWFKEVAQEAITIAKKIAPAFGISPQNHAFLGDEPIDDILATLRDCENARA